jgi:hypothetical protein
MPHDYFTIGAKIVAAVAALTGLAYVAWNEAKKIQDAAIAACKLRTA